jgi:hypothetical protein
MDRPLPGYSVIGNKYIAALEHKGPAVYATGGETITAAQLGWGGIDILAAAQYSYSDAATGTYFVQVFFGVGASGAVASVKILWRVSATGAEVGAGVDLSAEAIRIFALGV